MILLSPVIPTNLVLIVYFRRACFNPLYTARKVKNQENECSFSFPAWILDFSGRIYVFETSTPETDNIRSQIQSLKGKTREII